MADKSLNKTELVAKIATESGQSQAAVERRPRRAVRRPR